MSEQETPQVSLEDEKSILLSRAKLMGISVSNNASVDTLKAKIEAHMQAKPDENVTEGTENPLEEQAKVAKTAVNFREQLILDATKLIRLRITNMDPKKKDLRGEILTVANEFIGNIRKFVPYGEATDEGYHVPYCIYEMMKEREFQQIKTLKKNGQIVVETRMVREFALEVLDPLTKDELARLAAAQAAAGGLDD